MDYGAILKEIHKEVKPLIGKGKVADYIPELGKINPRKFAAAVTTVDGKTFTLGNAEEKFSIQSISKVYSLALAFGMLGEKIWKRVGKEPSGNPFNSLVQLEYEKGIPRNPFINAGAIVIADMLVSNLKNPKKELAGFVSELCGKKISSDKEVALSEKKHGFTNAALINLMKSHGNIENDINKVLDLYFYMCAFSMNCVELAGSFLFLANHGVIPSTGKRILTISQSKRLSAIMLTCGLYDESGDFAFHVGMPGKSGVGGGIAAIIPNRLSIAVWSPGLNKFGNSIAGSKALELFTTKTEVSIF